MKYVLTLALTHAPDSPAIKHLRITLKDSDTEVLHASIPISFDLDVQFSFHGPQPPPTPPEDPSGPALDHKRYVQEDPSS